MSSINTNVAAMTALQSLNQTNKMLTQTQGHISTGLRVAEASDNAAYWSIATTMKSDKQALSTVQDALGLGASMTDVAYTVTVIDRHLACITTPCPNSRTYEGIAGHNANVLDTSAFPAPSAGDSVR